MTYTVVWMVEAMASFRRLRAEDPAGAALVAAVVRDLANDHRPPNSRGLGETTFRRLRVESYRVLYEIDEPTGSVAILSVGRVGPSR